jgi:hypothetical protein
MLWSDVNVSGTTRRSTCCVRELIAIEFQQLLVVFSAVVVAGGLAAGGQDFGRLSQPVQARVGDYDVHAYGPYDVLSVSPTYFPDRPLQQGNNQARRKILPKKSWEIRSNYIGLTTTRLPSSMAAEIEPRNPVFFIDENESTAGFAGLPDGNPASARARVRVLLPSVTVVRSVALSPQRGSKVPKGINIDIHRWERWDRDQPEEAGTWTTVFQQEGRPASAHARSTNTAPAVHQPEVISSNDSAAQSTAFVCEFPPVEAREIWISSPEDVDLGEVRVLDVRGRNVASIAAGGTVAVSRRSHLFWLDEDKQRHLWPMTYDLGVKWVRVNYYLTPLIWPYVERARGLYRIDPYTKAILREAAQNGVVINLTLGPPEHPLYTAASREVQIKAFCDYVRFMVREFRDFVSYFEVFNEYYNQDAFDPGKSGDFERSAKEYAEFALPAVRVIREESKGAKIILCGPCPLAVDWIDAALATGLAPLVDVISWHPYQLTEPPEALDRPRHPWAGAELTRYEDAVRYLQDLASRRGFRGTYQANEAGAYAIHQMRSTALVSAKYMARSLVLHSSLGVPVFWNETVSLLRPAWQPFFWLGQPDVQPDYSYYVLRTLSTVMDGAEPVRSSGVIDVQPAPKSGEIESRLFSDHAGNLLLALWRPVRSADQDQSEAVPCNVRVRGFSARSAIGFELFNGEEQELAFQQDSLDVTLDGLLVRDYPLFVRLVTRGASAARN